MQKMVVIIRGGNLVGIYANEPVETIKVLDVDNLKDNGRYTNREIDDTISKHLEGCIAIY